MLMACLNPRTQPAPSVRLGALKGIEAARPIGAQASYVLGAAAGNDPDAAVRDDVLHANALGALRELGDPRVCQALLQYVTAEIRATNVSAASMDTRQIDTYSANSGANVNVLVPLALPIQMPSLTMQQIKTTVRVPAVSALRDLSGQDFGEDWDKWDQWARKQK
jgi:predicted xylose isomerase-like sugar epimerase